MKIHTNAQYKQKLANKIVTLVYGHYANKINKSDFMQALSDALRWLPVNLNSCSMIAETIAQQFLAARTVGMLLIAKPYSQDRQRGLAFLHVAETSLEQLKNVVAMQEAL